MLLGKISINCLQIINCEADDLIASFVVQNKETSPTTVFDIFTRDKDLLQLLNENVNILKYIKGKITRYTLNNFCQEYNFSPLNYLDYLSLLGDSVDNIPGIKGIGPVNAKKLIGQFHTIENLYQELNNLPEPLLKLLEKQQELTLANKKIISLLTNIILPTDLYKKCDFN